MATPQQAAVRILMVDDHVLVRSGLRMLIESQPGLVVAGEAENRDKAITATKELQPDLILLDLDLGGETSLDFLPELQQLSPGTKIILLTGARDPEEHLRAVRLGAMGVVLKD